MAKYVDVEKVFCADCEDRDRCGSPDVFCDVHSMPAADVAPVVHGEWKTGYPITCSVCGGYAATEYEDANIYEAWLSPCCPHCGAKMDGEREGDDGT